ncbi:MAG TPA: HDOD domain-containing protein [Bacteroidetes bacterium]|nr:HDOD domain-containing protein [Bacteroidota bacterium]
MSEIKILFVDDEPNILGGLRRMLRNMRHEWQMKFVGSGQEALQALQEEPFDVIVSDMRMPGMNGAELLIEVMNRYPRMIRIILSGYTDQDLILKAVRPAHQYLSKPSNADKIINTIKRAGNLRNLLKNENLLKIVAQVDTLPSLPDLYWEILHELRSENSSLQKIEKIISRDVGMTAKILQLVNSAFFGLPRHISIPAQAVSLLGIDIIKTLVLSVQIFSESDGGEIAGFSLKEIIDHSFYTAKMAKEIARAETGNNMVIDDAYMAGVLHDAGKMILCHNFPQQYAEVLALTKRKEIPEFMAEKEIFGTSHSKVGAYLMGLWGMSDAVVEDIAYHHNPAAAPDREFSSLTALYVANIFEKNLNGSHDSSKNSMDYNYLTGMGMENHVDDWQELCRKVKNRSNYSWSLPE